jgi:hypothetical protein
MQAAANRLFRSGFFRCALLTGFAGLAASAIAISSMIQSAENILSQYLDTGERLLWSGRSRGGIRFRAQDAFLIPFSIAWCSFAIFWEVNAIRMGAPFFFKLWGIPFVCVGLFFVFGRFWYDAYSRARTTYGVTNERIIIISSFFSRQTKSLPLRNLADISLAQRNDGSGTITFGPTHLMNNLAPAGAWPGMGRYAPPAFDLIERAKDVYDIIRNAQKAAYTNAHGESGNRPPIIIAAHGPGH